MEMEQSVEQWFAMRVTYQRELIAKGFFDEVGVESFVPTRMERRVVASRRKVCRCSLLHNYIFVHSTRERLDEIKQFSLPYLRYVMHTQNGERQVMVVPDDQMRNFITVAGSEEEHLRFLAPDTVDLAKGMRVRVTGGLFVGAEGVLMKVTGARERRVVVKIEGVAAVAAPVIDARLIEPIE